MTGYTYNEKERRLKKFGENFESRLGDNSGRHDQDYLDMVKLCLSMKREGSLLDIGAGLGRITNVAKNIVSETIALEPDEKRWRYCHTHYHDPPRCKVLCQFASDYICDNPEKRFDIVVIGMVIQHISTGACQALFKDAASLLKPDGVGIIFTTHTVKEARGFSFSRGVRDEAYVSQEVFDDYAEDHLNQDKGIPVRRFTKDELIECLEPQLETVYWRQVSYVREGRSAHFEKLYQLEPGKLKDTGISQFAVVRKAT